MGVTGARERATFTLAPSVKSRLEQQIPKSERSRFVEEAVDKALKQAAKEEALKAIREFKRFPSSGENSTEVLRRIRGEMDGRPVEILDGRKR